MIRQDNPSPANDLPIGGVLYVIGAGLVIAPFSLANDLFTMLQALFSDLAPALDPSLTGLLRFSAATDAILLGYVVWILFLFFKKKKAFCRHLTNFLILSVIIAAVDFFMSLKMNIGEDARRILTLGLLINAARAGAIIPYLRFSRRVRNTFVR